MEYRLSKQARIAIIINIVLTLIVSSIHLYNFQRIKETDELIHEVMIEKKVTERTAIRMLENDGVELYLKDGFSVVLGLNISIISLVLLIIFARKNGFVLGFITAFTCVFTSYIGGFILFYIILSGRSQASKKGTKFSAKDEWEKYIHDKSTVSDVIIDK